jgi:hypothetical protein
MPERQAVDVESLPDRAADGFVLHRCFCRYATILGSHGFDTDNRYCYKIMFRDRRVIVYFGVFTNTCKDCKRTHRIRLLPREKKVDIKVLAESNSVE